MTLAVKNEGWVRSWVEVEFKKRKGLELILPWSILCVRFWIRHSNRAIIFGICLNKWINFKAELFVKHNEIYREILPDKPASYSIKRNDTLLKALAAHKSKKDEYNREIEKWEWLYSN